MTGLLTFAAAAVLTATPGAFNAPARMAAELRVHAPAARAAPLPLAAKLAVLRKGGIVVRDLPTGPPRVTVAKPVDGDLSVNFFSAFGVLTSDDYAELRDGVGFIALNFNGVQGAIYLADCEVSPGSGTTKIEVAADGSAWTPATVTAGHLIYALPPVPASYPAARAFAFRAKGGGTGFRACEVTKVK